MRRQEAVAIARASGCGCKRCGEAAEAVVDALTGCGLIKFGEPLANEGTEDITQGLIDLIRADLDSANPAKALGEDLALAGLALVKVRRADPRLLPVTPEPLHVTLDRMANVRSPRRVPRYPDRTPAEVLADVQLGTGAHPEQWLVGRGPNGADRLIAALAREGFSIVRTTP